MVGGTGDVEDDSAAVVVAWVKTQVTVYPAGQGLRSSALTASGCGSGCLPAVLGGNYAAQAFSGVEAAAIEVLSYLIAATQRQCCAGLEHSVFGPGDGPAVAVGSCWSSGCYLGNLPVSGTFALGLAPTCGCEPVC